MIIFDVLINELKIRYDLMRLLSSFNEILYIGIGYDDNILHIGLSDMNIITDDVNNCFKILSTDFGYTIKLHTRVWFFRSPYYNNKNGLLIHSIFNNKHRFPMGIYLHWNKYFHNIGLQLSNKEFYK